MKILKKIILLTCILCTFLPTPVFASIEGTSNNNELLTITIKGAVDDAIINIHNDKTGNVVDSFTYDPQNRTCNVPISGSYYITVNWPSKYYRDFTKYPVTTTGNSGVATVKGELIPDEIEFVPVNIVLDSELQDLTFTIYYKNSNVVAEDIQGNKLDNIHPLTNEYLAYLPIDKNYEISSITIPNKTISENIKIPIDISGASISRADSRDVEPLAINFPSTLKSVENSIQKREAGYAKLKEMYDEFEKNKLPDEELYLFEEAYAAAVAEMTTTSEPDEITGKYLSTLKSFESEKRMFSFDLPDLSYVTYLLPFVFILILVFALVIIKFSKKKNNKNIKATPVPETPAPEAPKQTFPETKESLLKKLTKKNRKSTSQNTENINTEEFLNSVDNDVNTFFNNKK